MKKIVLTGLFVFGLMFAGTSVQAMGGEVHLVGKDGIVTNQLKYTQTLRRGTVNANVLALQRKLKEFGFYHKALDSDYGSGTIAAVKQFQRAKGLKDDGIAGPKTFAMILATDATLLNTGGIKPVKPIAGICTKEYAPVCGIPGIHEADAAYVSKPVTFSNTCMANRTEAKILYKGKCKTKKPIDDTVSGGHAIPGWDDFHECLSVTSYDWNNTHYSRGQISKKIGSFMLENNCHDHVYLNNIEFYMAIDTMNIPFSDMYAEIGDEDYDINSVNIHSNAATRRGSFALEGMGNNPFTLEEGEEYELSIYADIDGSYSPWNNSGNKTISVIAFNEMDFESEDGDDGVEYNFDLREIWSQLVTIKH